MGADCGGGVAGDLLGALGELSRAVGLAAVSETVSAATRVPLLVRSAWTKPSFSWVKVTLKSPALAGKTLLKEDPATASRWGMGLGASGVVEVAGGGGGAGCWRLHAALKRIAARRVGRSGFGMRVATPYCCMGLSRDSK